ncbi:hypothetical protein BGX28_005032 [Mortierella sp. GBA30]|nr:hypothetical protein BGX28_005032 [Mortierella sp. GBA30]
MSTPASPRLEDTDTLPPRNDNATTIAAKATSKSKPVSRPSLPISAGSFTTSPFAIRDNTAGGLVSSPTVVPSIPSSSHAVMPFSNNATHAKQTGVTAPTASSKGNLAVSSSDTSTRTMFAGARFPDTVLIFRSNSGGDSSSSSTIHSKKMPQKQQQQLQPLEQMRPIYRPFSNIGGLVQPSRSLSYAGTPNNRLGNLTGAALSPTSPDAHGSGSNQVLHSTTLRKSLSVGKPSKKGIKSRLRKLRQKQGSSSRESVVNAFMTSGESDSEAFEYESDTFFNSGGIAHKFIPSSASSSTKSSSFSRPKLPNHDASLPPHPLLRNQHSHHRGSHSFSLASSNKNGSASGFEHGAEAHKDFPPAARFKDLFKNVGLSNNQYSAGSPSAPSTTTSDYPVGTSGALKPLQSRSTFPLFGDFLSGDDQPAASTKFRLRGPGRRKRRFTKKSHSAAGGMLAPFTTAGAAGLVTDDEDSGASRSDTRQHDHHHNHHHQPQHNPHNFLHHLQRRRRSRTTVEDIRQETTRDQWKQEIQEPQQRRISAALRDARQATQDQPNVLMEELVPLPTQFLDEFGVLLSSGNQGQYPQQLTSPPQPHPQQQQPLVAHVTPTSTAGSGLASLFSPPTATTITGATATMNNTPAMTLANQNCFGRRPTATKPEAICTKTFLFKSFQNLRFQGHYLFRVIGDRVEYKRVPVELEDHCTQYFREAYVTFRSLEKKFKALKEDRERRRRITNQFWPNNSLPEAPPPPQPLRQQQPQREMSDPLIPTLSKNVVVPIRANSGSDIIKSSVAWDQVRLGQTATNEESLVPLSGQGIGIGVGGVVLQGRKTGYQEQRYNPESSNNAIVRSIVGGRDRSQSVIDARAWNSSSSGMFGSGGSSLQSTTAAAMTMIQRSSPYHIRKRSWTSIREQQRVEQEQQRAAEEAHWKELEQKYREEFKQSTFGLELYLTEIVKGSGEFDRFDATVDMKAEKNRDTAVFTIENGDKTNKMSLESPSAKLIYEFLNWIHISLMDRGEPEERPVVNAPQAGIHRRSSLDTLDAFVNSTKRRVEDDMEDSDMFFDFIDIRISQQEERLRDMRESIQGTMRQIQNCVDGLDNLDENAKKLMTTMIRAIDSQEVQLALRPSPSTGMTLAETVEWKLKDVNDRIVICTRIMGAARYNLNRLRYEIELEQRSIRLFRQYKIIIGVVTISIVFLVWFLYHSRASALAPQPASPLFSTPVNPFEKDFHFHHGEPPILPAPTMTVHHPKSSEGSGSISSSDAVNNEVHCDMAVDEENECRSPHRCHGRFSTVEQGLVEAAEEVQQPFDPREP